MALTFGVLVFPGSNCDHDAYHVAGHVIAEKARFIWHKESTVGDVDVVIVPGGFSYGDYLRSGAIARFSPVMEDVVRVARDGGVVIGICNGFQILCEAGLLPGALIRNDSLRFSCRTVHLRVENTDSPFTLAYRQGQVLEMPIAHGDGNYFADPLTLEELESEDRIPFRYCTESGEVRVEANPNGSARNIACILNESRNVLGMMPHPERNSDPVLGRPDGVGVFRSIVEHLEAVRA
jgi:phosphoribosylformylglycinamidine synthase